MEIVSVGKVDVVIVLQTWNIKDRKKNAELKSCKKLVQMGKSSRNYQQQY